MPVCKDSYVVHACSFNRNGKWEWFCESKWRCKDDVAKMTLQKSCCNMTSQALTVLFADGIISDYSFNLNCPLVLRMHPTTTNNQPVQYLVLKYNFKFENVFTRLSKVKMSLESLVGQVVCSGWNVANQRGKGPFSKKR